MKSIIMIIALLVSTYAATAQQYVDKKGKTHFFSATNMENIEATSNTSVSMINVENKKVVVKIPNTSFKFKDGLMEEHFNENYMESDKYKLSSLEGTIVDAVDWSKDGTYDVTVKGTLDIHGVKQERDFKVKLTIKGGAPTHASTKFDVKLADHKIKIPSLLGANISESIAIDGDYTFEKYEKK